MLLKGSRIIGNHNKRMISFTNAYNFCIDRFGLSSEENQFAYYNKFKNVFGYISHWLSHLMFDSYFFCHSLHRSIPKPTIHMHGCNEIDKKNLKRKQVIIFHPMALYVFQWIHVFRFHVYTIYKCVQLGSEREYHCYIVFGYFLPFFSLFVTLLADI